jgi:hypothetical protein
LNPGSDQVTVYCSYFAGAGRRHIIVDVEYALPSDLDPLYDFFVGCASQDFAARLPNGAYAWNVRDRLYRVPSSNSWSYATFYDLGHHLAARDVPAFERIARTLLRSAGPAAHPCTLSGGPSSTAPTQH